MPKRLDLGNLWNNLLDRYPRLYWVERIIGYTIWLLILAGVGVLVWRGLH
ncbi:hypothetical protein [Hymenobacter sp. NBH84]|nr:hypothetical protein [Hymenobacter sp. NBH84]